MKSIKLILIAALCAFAGAASAQTCDMNMSMSMAHKGDVKLENAVKYHGLTAAQAQDIVTRSQSVLDEASKGQNKRGDYTFSFDGTNTCGITMAAIGPVDGLTHKDAMRVLRTAFVKAAEGHIQQSEKHVAGGGKGPWGNK